MCLPPKLHHEIERWAIVFLLVGQLVIIGADFMKGKEIHGYAGIVILISAAYICVKHHRTRTERPFLE